MRDATVNECLDNLDSLLGACRKRANVVSFLAPQLCKLDSTLAALRGAKARQVCLTAEKQQATAEVNKLLAEARELALGIRTGVKAVLGPRHPQLQDFRIAPLAAKRS
jgi:hypothetical protein